MKGIRFTKVIAVWKSWYKPIYMLVFLRYFSLNVYHLSDSIYIWNCCNQAQFFKQNKKIMKCLAIKIVCMKFFATPNSKNVIVTLRIVATERSELTFLLIFYIHDSTYSQNFQFMTLNAFKQLWMKWKSKSCACSFH